MQKPKKKGLKVFSVLTYLVLLGYYVMFFAAGIVCQRPDGGLLQTGAKSFVLGHIKLIPSIFELSLPAGAYWTWIILGYVVVVAAAIFIAVKIGGKTDRAVTANGMVAVMLSFVPVVLTACGFDFYLKAFQQVAPYAGRRTLFSAIILVGATVLFAIMAIALLFVCCKDALANPANAQSAEEPVEEPKEETPEESVEEEPVLEEKQKTEEEELEEILESMTREDLLALIKQGVREVLAEQESDIKAEGNVIKDGKGTPILVQYFRGLGVEDVTPLPAEPAPAPAPAPAAEEAETKQAAERVPFVERIANADKAMKEAYNEIKNELMSYGLKSRLSNSGDTFRLHRKTYVKMVMAGKGIKLYMALDPKAYADSPIPVQDVSEKNLYAEIPLAFKVKSDLSRRRAKTLIAECMAKDNIAQGEVGNVNWVRQIRADLKAQKEAK